MLCLIFVGLVASAAAVVEEGTNINEISNEVSSNETEEEHFEPHEVLTYEDSLHRCLNSSHPTKPVMPKTPEVWKMVSDTLNLVGYGDEHMWLPAKMDANGKLKWMDDTDVTITDILRDEDLDTSAGLCFAMSPTAGENGHPGELAPCDALLLPMICMPH